MNSIARSPLFWFCIALCTLAPLQIWFVSDSPWFSQPPKPIGDGPDYENIAWQLAQGRGWTIDWRDEQWRSAYLAASLSQLDVEQARRMPTDQIPIADYTAQLTLNDPAAPTTSRPPLLPACIAVIYWFVERGPTAFACVRVCLALSIAIAGSLAVAMTAACMGKISSASLPVILATMVCLSLAALDRTVRNYATDFLTEPLAMLLMQLWIWSLWHLLINKTRPADRAGLWAWLQSENAAIAICGALLALLISTRSLIVLWIPCIWLLMMLPSGWWSRPARAVPVDLSIDPLMDPLMDPLNNPLKDRDIPTDTRWGRFHRATMVMLVCFALLAPWWIRNCIVLESPLPLGTQGPITLLGGYNDQAFAMRGEWLIAPEGQLREELREQAPPQTARDVTQQEVQVAREAGRRVARWIRANILRLPYLAWLRIKTEWGPYTGRSLIWKAAALVGLWYLSSRLRPAALLLGGVLLINTLSVACLYSVGGRFLVPNYGVLYTLAGVGVAATLQPILSSIWPRTRR